MLLLCLFYLSFNFEFFISEKIHLYAKNLPRKPNNRFFLSVYSVQYLFLHAFKAEAYIHRHHSNSEYVKFLIIIEIYTILVYPLIESSLTYFMIILHNIVAVA